MWHVVLLHWGGRSLIRGAGEGLRTGWPQWRLSKAAKATSSVREGAFRLKLSSMWRAQQEQWDAVAHWDAGLPDGGLRLSVFSQELLGSLGGCSESSAPAEPAAVTPCLASAVALGTMSILWHAVPPGSSSMLFPPQWCCCSAAILTRGYFTCWCRVCKSEPPLQLHQDRKDGSKLHTPNLFLLISPIFTLISSSAHMTVRWPWEKSKGSFPSSDLSQPSSECCIRAKETSRLVPRSKINCNFSSALENNNKAAYCLMVDDIHCDCNLLVWKYWHVHQE